MDLKSLPEVSFAQKDVQTIIDDMISGYENAYYEQTGQQITLNPGDKVRIFLYSQALREFQLRQLIDFSAKQNLLKYASGDYLDNLGAFNNAKRLQASYATVSVKFTLSSPQPLVQIIPKGTRVSTSGGIYFQTTEDVEVSSGVADITIEMQCTTIGAKGNNFVLGQINVLVDPLPWISNVVNTDTSQGGADIESDDDFRERIRKAPEGYSVAGPSGAYEYFAKEYNQLVSDVKVSSPSAGNVDIRVLLQNGEIPDITFLSNLNDYISDKNRRPLTDNVSVKAPDIINYDINLTYYISNDDAAMISDICAKVTQAVSDFILWQKSKIGRDINVSELITKIMGAGAKRVNVTSPAYTAVTDSQVAVASANITATYGGLEDA